MTFIGEFKTMREAQQHAEIARLKAEIERKNAKIRDFINSGDAMSGTYYGPIHELLRFNKTAIALRSEVEG